RADSQGPPDRLPPSVAVPVVVGARMVRAAPEGRLSSPREPGSSPEAGSGEAWRGSGHPVPAAATSPPAGPRSVIQPPLPAGRRDLLFGLARVVLHLDVHRQVRAYFQGRCDLGDGAQAPGVQYTPVRLLRHPH